MLALFVLPASPVVAGEANGWIGYEFHPRDADGRCSDIAASSPRGGRLRIIIRTDLCERDGRFSPSGRRIAWTISDGTNATQLRGAHRGGQSSHVIADLYTGDGGWGWSNDDHSLVYIAEAPEPGVEEPDIWTTDALGRDLDRVTTTPARHEKWPAWSPDGTRIAFVADGDIFTIDLGTDLETQVTEDAEARGYPVWSPDSSSIAFESTKDDPWDPPEHERPLTSEIYVVAASGGEPTNVSNLGRTTDSDPHWLDAGELTWVAFHDPELCSGKRCDSEIFRAKADGTGRTKLTRNRGSESNIVVSPNGRWIAYNRDALKDRYSGAYKMRPSGKRVRKLTGVKHGWYQVTDWAPRYN